MIDVHLWVAFLLATSVFLVLPGPAVLVVFGQAIRGGLRPALLTAGGVMLGDLLLMLIAGSGVGALLLVSAEIFMAVKLAGAAYLIYLGVQAWRAGARVGDEAPPESAATPPHTGGLGAGLFGNGLLVNLTNPKAILFFMAFFPQFVTRELALPPQFAVLGASFLCLAGLSLLAYALLAGRLRRWLIDARSRRLQHRLTGGCLVAAGLGLAASE